MAAFSIPRTAHWQPAPSGSGFLEGVDDVAQCITNILITPKGSRPLNPDFGSDVYLYIDYPINQARPHIVRESVDAVRKWEKRCSITTVDVLEAAPATLLVRVGFKLADGIERFVEVRPS